MKQRHRRQRGRLQPARHDDGDQIRRGHRRDGANEVDVEQRLAHRALVGHYALGLAAGTRGKQNQRRVFGRQGWRLRRRATSGNQRCPRGIALISFAIDNDGAAIECCQVVVDMGKAVGVADQHARIDVAQAAQQFFAQTKAVQWCRHRTNQRGSGKRHRPFRTVAHGNGNAVAGLNTVVGLHASGQRISGGKKLPISPALAFVDHELVGAVDASGVEQRWQRGKSIAIGRQGLAVDLDGGQLKWRAGGGQLRAALRSQRHQFGFAGSGSFVGGRGRVSSGVHGNQNPFSRA